VSEIPDFNSASVEVEDTVEVVFQLMLEQGWSDGLPMIPPTPQLVRRMIDYVRRDPGEVIGYINPDGGAATVEKIAINGAMAGCLPEYMPVLIAAVQALTQPEFNIHGLQTTTNPVAPLLVVNGLYWLHTSVTSDCTQTCVTLAPTVGGCRGGS
jgi:hypothetical protein